MLATKTLDRELSRSDVGVHGVVPITHGRVELHVVPLVQDRSHALPGAPLAAIPLGSDRAHPTNHELDDGAGRGAKRL